MADEKNMEQKRCQDIYARIIQFKFRDDFSCTEYMRLMIQARNLCGDNCGQHPIEFYKHKIGSGLLEDVAKFAETRDFKNVCYQAVAQHKDKDNKFAYQQLFFWNRLKLWPSYWKKH